MEDAAEECAAARDRAADERAATARELTGVGEALGEAHADRRADGRREAGDERIAGVVRGEHDREDRRERRQRAVDEPDHRGLHTLEKKGVLVGH